MLDLAILTAFVAYSVTMGFRARRQAGRGVEQYFLAGRSVKGWRAGVSMAATQFAADTPLLVMGLIATGGIFRIWQLWVYGLAFLALGFIFSGPWRRAGVLTDAELAELRYSRRGALFLRAFKAVFYGTVINCVVLAFVLVAAMRVAEIFLPWHLWLPNGLYAPIHHMVAASGLVLDAGGTAFDVVTATTNNMLSLLALLSFTALYSTTGGLRSVVATDVMQFGLAIVATGLYAAIVIAEAGGMDAMGRQLVALYGARDAARFLSFAPPANDLLLPFLTIMSLQWLFQMYSDGTGYLAQRTMACRTDRDARHAALIFSWAQIVLRSLLWLVIGVGLLVLLPFTPEEANAPGFAAAREAAFITGINEFLPPGIRGLMLTGILAALASTIDTHLNWGASYWSNDIYRRLVNDHWLKRRPGARELVLVARLSNLLVLALALVVVTRLDSVQEGWRLSLLFGAGVGSVLVLRWLWERINLYSEIGAMAAALIGGILLLSYFPADSQEWIRLAIMAALSTGVAVLAPFVTPETENPRLSEFYRRARPMGFWRRTAASVGDDPGEPAARLRHRLLLTGVMGGAVFCALIGSAKLILPPPGREVLFGGLLLLAAAGLGCYALYGLDHEERLKPLPAEKE